MSQTQNHREHLRGQILHDHIEQVARRHPSSFSKLIAGLTYATAISLLDESSENPRSDSAANEESAKGVLPGGLSEDDLKRFGSSSLQLDSRARNLLENDLKETLLSILNIWSPGEGDKTNEARLQIALRLPEEIHSYQDQMAATEKDIKALRLRIQGLIKEVNEIHPRLESDLLQALQTLPPLLEAERSAQSDVLALTIETCLLKLSLIRARTHNTLYNYTLPPSPSSLPGTQATMQNALNAVQRKLRQKEREQQDEEGVLNRQIEEYEGLLELVGASGGYKQLVDDMTRVKKETEECKKDLRRLGWTGD